MEENTRVKKYAKLRDDIAKMDDNSMYQTPYQVPSNKSIDDSTSQEDVTAPIKHVGKRTRSLSLDDIFAAHDQYSSITGQDQEKDIKAFEEEQERLEKKNRIIIISLFGVAVAILIILIIYFIIN
ncbi:MAG: hypothetical protein ACI318_01325 [Bacilli bacterium]|nr:hypothetical protein [Erysipelotrichaceae bacterium]MDD6249877.1 hypothetical protein [Bacillales bacterium]MDY2746177.1 hypothetical protein [Bacilli bacterium]MDD7382550.1 hypothetical protein [Bacillales bacterium]MDY3890563.1 hypothetical protein [Bacilli bacterium]